MKIGSLCSGYGGLDLATEAATGATPAWFCEFDKAPSKVLAHHWPHLPNYGDVWHTDWTGVEPVDILTAGYPCQPFSHAGKRLGTDDPRHLFPAIVTAIRALRPGLVVLENVRGHLRLGFDTVLGALADCGYDARWVCVRASDVGAPHKRERIFIAAYPSDADSEFRHGCGGVGSGRWVEPANGSHVAADTGSERHGGGENRRAVGRVDGPDAGQAWERERSREVTEHRSATPFGEYEPAIRRWEGTLGRSAPLPTELGDGDRPRLSARFTEWMMGLPDGWVTDPVIGVARSNQLKILGNGVVPQQAVHALNLLLGGNVG